MLKKSWYLLICITMIVLFCACSTSGGNEGADQKAYTDVTVFEGIKYSKIGGELWLVGYEKDLPKNLTLSIPENVGGVPVVGIEKNALRGLSQLTELYVPGSVSVIRGGAFAECKNLNKVTLSEGIHTLEGEVFMKCASLKSIAIPTTVTVVRGNAFQDCASLENVSLHDGITEIHAYAFQNCASLTHIVLPSGITEIRANTFENCIRLRSISIPAGVWRIAAHAFRGCNALSNVAAPDSLREIGSSAFRECKSLKSISLPRNVSVDERAFKNSPTKISYR